MEETYLVIQPFSIPPTLHLHEQTNLEKLNDYEKRRKRTKENTTLLFSIGVDMCLLRSYIGIER